MNEEPPPATPLCDQLRSHKDKADIVWEFLEWLQAQGYEVTDRSEFSCLRQTQLLYAFLKIDENELEKERRALLAYQRDSTRVF